MKSIHTLNAGSENDGISDGILGDERKNVENK